jgi:hypothetical protein
LSASQWSTIPICGLNVECCAADLQLDLLLRPSTEQEVDEASHDAEHSENHQPKPGGIDALIR